MSIDLWKPYLSLVKELMPNAEIIADRFHIMKIINTELDNQRKKINKDNKAKKNTKKKARIIVVLKKSKYALIKNEKDLTEQQKDKLKIVKKVIVKLGKMHDLKEQFRDIFEKTRSWVLAIEKLLDWLKEAQKFFPTSCQTIKRWFPEIIGYFETRTTQGVVEGINNKLKLIKRAAYG